MKMKRTFLTFCAITALNTQTATTNQVAKTKQITLIDAEGAQCDIGSDLQPRSGLVYGATPVQFNKVTTNDGKAHTNTKTINQLVAVDTASTFPTYAPGPGVKPPKQDRIIFNVDPKVKSFTFKMWITPGEGLGSSEARCRFCPGYEKCYQMGLEQQQNDPECRPFLTNPTYLDDLCSSGEDKEIDVTVLTKNSTYYVQPDGTLTLTK